MKEYRFRVSDTRIQAIIKPSQILVILGKDPVGATTEGIAFDSLLAGKINLWRC